MLVNPASTTTGKDDAQSTVPKLPGSQKFRDARAGKSYTLAMRF